MSITGYQGDNYKDLVSGTTGAAASSIPFAAGIGAPLGIASAGATATSSFLGFRLRLMHLPKSHMD